MSSLVFLAHRIPYPPDKGDKIRSFHFLKALSERYEIYLGAFVDDPTDLQYKTKLSEYCTDVHLVSINKKLNKIKSLRALLGSAALSVEYYKNSSMKAWLDKTIQSVNPDVIFCFSSTMAQYIPVAAKKNPKKILDYVDVDSTKWREYADSHGFPLNYIYSREAARLLDFEKKHSRSSDLTLFVSPEEAQLYNKISNNYGEFKVDYVFNGVDTEYFSPERNYSDPYPPGVLPIVFTGVMDYWANVDAVIWFVKDALAKIHLVCPNAVFYIVGKKPNDEVLSLESYSGVVVTGAVDDVRPYLHYARLAVAPLRIARGIQNKVLEAMAMAKPVVATPNALNGLGEKASRVCFVGENESDIARHVSDILIQGDIRKQGVMARKEAVENFGWNAQLDRLFELIGSLYAAENKTGAMYAQ